MPKQPQDHKPKSTSDAYTFRHDGVTHHLAAGETVATQLPGRFLRDAALDGEEGQMRLAFAMLEKVASSEGAVDALYDMPASQMLEHIQAWMEFKPTGDDGEEASLGESSRSSA